MSVFLPSTRASSGVMVAHLMPTLYFLIASAASIVTWSFVWNFWHPSVTTGATFHIERAHIVAVLHAQVIILDIKIKVRVNKLFLDILPDNSCHFVAVQINNRVLDLDAGTGRVMGLDGRDSSGGGANSGAFGDSGYNEGHFAVKRVQKSKLLLQGLFVRVNFSFPDRPREIWSAVFDSVKVFISIRDQMMHRDMDEQQRSSDSARISPSSSSLFEGRMHNWLYVTANFVCMHWLSK